MKLRGGVPLFADGLPVGAVGIAGLNKDNDVSIVQAATVAFASKKQLTTVRALNGVGGKSSLL